MSKKKVLSSQRQPQKLFQPKVRRNSRNSKKYLSDSKNKNYSFTDFKNTNLFSDESFRYNDKPALVSTQEINTDYNELTNHTFFHSAIAKNNEFFDLVLNKFPYDGSNKEIEAFEDGLTGYEKHLYNQYPKNKGYLIFSGTVKGETQQNGTSIKTEEYSGAQFASIASNLSGKSGINPVSKPLNIQVFLNLPKQPNDNQTVFQKHQSIANNFGLYLSQSNSSDSCDVKFIINSGSNSLSSSINIPKGEFVHITAQYHDCNKYSSLMAIPESLQQSVPQHLYATSSNRIYFETISPSGSLNLGSGSEIRTQDGIFTPQQTFSGSMDEFRIIHRAIDIDEVKRNYKKSISGQDEIALYYKFNEPEGDYAGNNMVLDASGNSFNSTINNYLPSYTRSTGSHDLNPMTQEKISQNPILFPQHPDVKSLHSSLMEEAQSYDDFNPNIITRLIPPHYLELGGAQDNTDEILGTLKIDFLDKDVIESNKNTPTSVQLLVKMLLTWAKVFDEIKIYVDHFSTVNFVEYEEKDTVSDKFLERLGIHLGLRLPRLFSSAKIDQLIEGINLQKNPQNSILTLLEIQNLIWRRILSDIANIKQSKGSLDAIRSIFRSSGIEAENIFNFREYGGSRIRSLEGSREIKKDVISFLNFSGSTQPSPAALNHQGYSSNIPYLVSPFLSASRVEPGKPFIRGTYVNPTIENPNGLSNNKSDGLLTTSSFTIQAAYVFDPRGEHQSKQSLFRFNVTGSDSDAEKEACIVNAVYDRSGNVARVYVSDGIADKRIHEMYLTASIMDGDVWSVFLSRKDGINSENTEKDKYEFALAKYSAGTRQEYLYTASYFSKKPDSVLSNVSSAYNSSGSFVVIGSQSLGPASRFINNTAEEKEKTTYFSGKVSYLNFWSANKEQNEFLSFAKNPNSVGTNNPALNYNFSKNNHNSFERLRIHTIGKQATTSSDSSGKFRLFDFTQNDNHVIAHNLEPNKVVFAPENIIYEILSENFDLNSAKNKVRVRSFQDVSLQNENDYAKSAPAYEIPPLEETVDDTRFSIDMSAMKGLNENIMTIFPDFQPLENALGSPNSVFGEDYLDMRSFRRIYFNNLIDDLDLGKYRSIFKWIDNSYTDLVYSLVPRTTNFLGINFIYEQHVLERNKFKYLYDEIYLKALPRSPREPLLLSQFVSKICKF